MPLHPEAEQAIKDQLAAESPATVRTCRSSAAHAAASSAPPLLNDALTHGCKQANLGYRVTIHGLRHSIANWLKTAGVPTPDIQATLRHTDPRTTATYLHTSTQERTQAINKLPSRPTTA
jgi:integrase